jgi:glycosyltransferase involved in cell wall biosynthesis
MKILIITENFRTGGLETQVIGFVKHLVKAGHEVYLISGLNSRTAPLKGLIGEANIFEVDMNPHLSTSAFSEPLYKIISYTKEIDPDVVHLHPFTSIIYGGLASTYLEKPYVVTLHGPASVSSWGCIYRIFLEIILKDAFKVFCVSREVYERAKAIIEGANLVLLPNGVDTERFKPVQVDPSGPVALISRLDSDKIPGIKAFLTLWSGLSPQERNPVHIFGDGFSLEELKAWVKHELKGEDWIKFMGHRDDLDEVLKTGYSAVAGMGRVILEALAMGLPAILVGYDGVKGVVTLDNVEDFAKRNFSGRYSPNVGVEELLEGIKKALRERALLRDWVKKKADEGRIVERYLEELRNLPEEKEYSWKEPLFSAILDAEDAAIFGDKVFFNLVRNFSLGKELSNWINFHLVEKLTLSEAEKQRIMKEKEELLQKLNENLKELEELRRESEELRSQNEGLRRENEEIRSQRDYYINKLNEIYTSNFWKVARTYYKIRYNIPLRYLKPIGKRLKKILSSINNAYKTGIFEKEIKELLSLIENYKKQGKYVFIYPPTVDWNIPLYQRPHHFANEIAKLGHLFIFCTPNSAYDKVDGYQVLRDGLVITNLWNGLLTYKNVLTESYIIFHSTNLFIGYNELLEIKKNGIKIIYDYIDEIDPAISGDTSFIIQRHKNLKPQDVDLVCCVSKKLYTEMIQRFPEEMVIYLPNGVEFERFNIGKDENIKPIQFRDKNIGLKPVIGYFGALARWIDYELIKYAAKNLANVDIVLIGLDYDGSLHSLLSLNLPNLHYFGIIPYSQLPKYAIWFDVAIIPFQEGEIAKATSPIKMYEYMALGKPIVVTKDLLECYGYDYVFVSKTKEEFVENIKKALQIKDDPMVINRLKEIAKQNSWQARVETLIKRIEELENEA